jgi:hypothetical protein
LDGRWLVVGASFTVAVAELDDGNYVQGAVDLPVTCAGGPVADPVAEGCVDRDGAVPGCEVALTDIHREQGGNQGADYLEAGQGSAGDFEQVRSSLSAG